MGGSSKPNKQAPDDKRAKHDLWQNDRAAFNAKYPGNRGGGLPKDLVGLDFSDPLPVREEPEPIAVADTDDADKARGLQRRNSSRSKTIITGDLMPDEENLKRKRLLGG